MTDDFDAAWADACINEMKRLPWCVFNNTGPCIGRFPNERLAKVFAAALPGTNTVVMFGGAAAGVGVTRYRDGKQVHPKEDTNND